MLTQDEIDKEFRAIVRAEKRRELGRAGVVGYALGKVASFVVGAAVVAGLVALAVAAIRFALGG